MKNVLVLIHDDAGQEARFQAALDLTRALDGHLTCLDVSILPVAVDDYAAVGGSALLIAEEQVNESKNRARIDARLQSEDVAYDWVETTGFASPSVRGAAKLADLIVLNRDIKHAYPDMEEIVGEVLIKSGHPVIAVPADTKGFDAYGPALIAWDGSTEAEKALRSAVPLLRLASGVTIVEVDDGSIQWPANAAAIYLSRHGIKAVVRKVRHAPDIPSTVLLEEIQSHRAAYLVMGGFGHSRFVEAVIGGFTRRMLHESPVPLFLAH